MGVLDAPVKREDWEQPHEFECHILRSCFRANHEVQIFPVNSRPSLLRLVFSRKWGMLDLTDLHVQYE